MTEKDIQLRDSCKQDPQHPKTASELARDELFAASQHWMKGVSPDQSSKIAGYGIQQDLLVDNEDGQGAQPNHSHGKLQEAAWNLGHRANAERISGSRALSNAQFLLPVAQERARFISNFDTAYSALTGPEAGAKAPLTRELLDAALSGGNPNQLSADQLRAIKDLRDQWDTPTGVVMRNRAGQTRDALTAEDLAAQRYALAPTNILLNRERLAAHSHLDKGREFLKDGQVAKNATAPTAEALNNAQPGNEQGYYQVAGKLLALDGHHKHNHSEKIALTRILQEMAAERNTGVIPQVLTTNDQLVTAANFYELMEKVRQRTGE